MDFEEAFLRIDSKIEKLRFLTADNFISIEDTISKSLAYDKLYPKINQYRQNLIETLLLRETESILRSNDRKFRLYLRLEIDDKYIQLKWGCLKYVDDFTALKKFLYLDLYDTSKLILNAPVNLANNYYQLNEEKFILFNQCLYSISVLDAQCFSTLRKPLKICKKCIVNDFNVSNQRIFCIMQNKIDMNKWAVCIMDENLKILKSKFLYSEKTFFMRLVSSTNIILYKTSDQLWTIMDFDLNSVYEKRIELSGNGLNNRREVNHLINTKLILNIQEDSLDKCFKINFNSALSGKNLNSYKFDKEWSVDNFDADFESNVYLKLRKSLADSDGVESEVYVFVYDHEGKLRFRKLVPILTENPYYEFQIVQKNLISVYQSFCGKNPIAYF
jgi:hypothetical protein